MKKPLKQLIAPVSSIVFACLIVAVFTTIGVLQQAATTSAGERQLPIYCVQTEKKEIALTFDAAWGNSDTDELLTLLEENGAKATFFCTGEWVDNYPDDVKRLFDAGHEIQNHSDKHPHPNELSFEALITDTQACDEKIHAITGVYPTLYRSPYGEYNDKVIQTMKSVGKRVIQWDVDSIDWKDPSPEEMVNRVLSKVGNGSILLFHNDAENTPEALRKLLPELKAQGYEIKTVSEILLPGRFDLNNEGRMIPVTDSGNSADTASEPAPDTEQNGGAMGLADILAQGIERLRQQTENAA
ncbi:MAG: polysaccharide deacetylase family protein [Oscillospiraceae bacterium]